MPHREPGDLVSHAYVPMVLPLTEGQPPNSVCDLQDKFRPAIFGFDLVYVTTSYLLPV